jgi:hypothetical protein
MAAHNPLDHLQDTTSFFDGEYTATSVTITICSALALYNAIELILLIFTTFRKYSGLYFWSLAVSSVGLIPYCLAYMIQYFQLTKQLAGEIVSCFGWPMVVTGQSFVLYSRLGVVLGPSHQRILRAVKWMIIVDGVVFHVVTQIVMFGAFNAHPNHGFAQAYKYIEKIQMTGFTIQELILSSLYVWRTLDILKTGGSRRRNRVMRELLAINAFIIIMDIALLVVEYQDRHVIEQALKAVVYSVKLKLEFAILSKLVGIARNSEDDSSDMLDDGIVIDNHELLEYEKSRNDNMILPPFQRESRSDMKGTESPLHIERASSWLSGTTYKTQAGMSELAAMPSSTTEERRRRQNLEEDLYADAIRSVTN